MDRGEPGSESHAPVERETWRMDLRTAYREQLRREIAECSLRIVALEPGSDAWEACSSARRRALSALVDASPVLREVLHMDPSGVMCVFE